MERENIERLAIDSAAGELSEDAAALFRAYLAEHPAAGRWAQDMLQTYEKTQAAINTKTADRDVGSGKPVIEKNRLPSLPWPSLMRWAAVLIVGVLIGLGTGRWGTADRTNEIAPTIAHQGQGQVQTVQDLKEKYAGTFWGDRVLALLEHGPRQSYRAYHSDISLWDKYKQYMKEKHHE